MPPSTGLYVRIDLGPLGGSASQAMYDDGSHGDVAPNDNVFTLRTTTPLSAASNLYALTFTVGDAESRSATGVLHFHILPPIVVSQLYTCGGGGGGSQGFNHSYIELHNRGAQAVSLVGWSLQYAMFANGNWGVTPLSGTIQPGQYFLVQESNSCGGASLPAPDLIGPSFMTPSAGKIVLLAGHVHPHGLVPDSARSGRRRRLWRHRLL